MTRSETLALIADLQALRVERRTFTSHDLKVAAREERARKVGR